jgi:hypothetical protein
MTTFGPFSCKNVAMICNLLPLKERKTLILLKPTVYVMHQQFNIQQLYALPTLYLNVLYLTENKERLVPLTVQTD